MILHAAKVIVNELNIHFTITLTDALSAVPPTQEDTVELGNIALAEGNGGNVNANLQNKIIVTVVNLREDKVLKNTAHQKVDLANMRTDYFNPSLFVNTFLLFSATSSDYSKSISEISRVIRFFQFRNIFTHNNTDLTIATKVPLYDRMTEFKLIMDLYSPSFEELNHLWGTLGGKQYPSVLYMMRMLELKHVPPTYEGGGVIQEVQRNYNPLTKYQDPF
ncbi:Protein of unknown function [Pseudarcicella hirudinis]|uniref:Pvc16 N-terminal domain-containing protein n=2 Tax=Pseudarcicella hirudinis TaxID=1079859 RepID=A0A1I5N721_9BACT|nr:DUF4255 domain-containing protein [Pseudarcicella hirudinis]SFP17096.1 Protein of unknown function [Pseudarcicella hirudinis]